MAWRGIALRGMACITLHRTALALALVLALALALALHGMTWQGKSWHGMPFWVVVEKVALTLAYLQGDQRPSKTTSTARALW